MNKNLTAIGGIITSSAAGDITYINQAACELMGCFAGNVLGHKLTDVFKVVNGGEPVVYTSRDKGAAEKPFPSGSMLQTFNGEELSICGSVAVQVARESASNGHVVSFFEEISKEADAEQMHWYAMHDPLTRLPNRLLLANRFKEALILAKRHQTALAVCMMDLDKFKPVNDTYGHAAGDLLLIEAASRIRQHLRQEDTVARFGGDEFVLLIGDADSKEELLQAIQRLQIAIAEPYSIEGEKVSLSCSIGLALYPEDDADADTLLRHADQAMFLAKQAGRNRVHLFDVKQDQKLNSSQKIISRVEQALINKEFELYYQPKVNMRTGQVIGMEALIRWQHPKDGLILPVDFLPFIEQNDVIIDIGRWVLESALTQLTQWQKKGRNWSVSINIAARHFHVPNFSLLIAQALKRFPSIRPEQLEIEILESAALGDVQHVQTVIEECKALGVRFALDDFGTGYSSLSYLKRIPVEVLKIDRSFIRDILNDKEDLALVQAIASLAVTFDREVVAEGVETVEQGALLMRLGCDVAQGYHIAKPMPAGNIDAWVVGFKVDPLWEKWSKREWDLRAFPLLVAQYDIRDWNENVVMKIADGSLPVEDAKLSNESKCRFGHWYKTDGQEIFSESALFKAIDPVHSLLHQEGNLLIQLYANGRRNQAKKKCVEVYRLKDKLLTMLDDLQREFFVK